MAPTAKTSLGLVVAGLVLVLAAFWLFAPAGGSEAKLVRVPKGATAHSIGALLAEKGVVRSATGFALYARLTHKAGKLQSGTYRFAPGLPLGAILEKLASGETEAVKLTVPEGFSVRRIAERVQAQGLGSAQRFLVLCTTERGRFKQLFDPPCDTLEGYLFPDTYLVEPGADEADLITRMLQRMKQELASPEIAPLLKQSKYDLHQVLTVASLVEAEAEKDSERPLIAAVFYNRLRLHMPLESCATVEYALGQHKAALSVKDTYVDSPYNTYRHYGLPPGPICSPGHASILAALKPAKVDYLFFTAKPDGSHYFTRTYKEHLNKTLEARGRKRRP